MAEQESYYELIDDKRILSLMIHLLQEKDFTLARQMYRQKYILERWKYKDEVLLLSSPYKMLNSILIQRLVQSLTFARLACSEPHETMKKRAKEMSRNKISQHHGNINPNDAYDGYAQEKNCHIKYKKQHLIQMKDSRIKQRTTGQFIN